MTDVNALPIHLSAALAGLVAKAAPSIVSVRSRRSQSSGFAWRSGLVVTADEALSEQGEFAVTVPGGDSVPAQLVGRDPTTDVALLRIDRSDLPPLPLTATSLAVGALAVAVGSDDGAPIAALGVVSREGGPWRSLRGGEITPGSSLICVCGDAPKAASRSMRPAPLSAWRCSAHGDACWSFQRRRSSAWPPSLRATAAFHAAISGSGFTRSRSRAAAARAQL
jgi:Trypsin-like peptidase domain